MLWAAKKNLFLAFLGALFVLLVQPGSGKALAASPNVVVIQVDDMSSRLLFSRVKDGKRWVPALPNIRQYFIEGGTRFRRYYASNPLCAPSRATLLTGLAAHNTGVRTHGADSGFRLWRSSKNYRDNLPVWLQKQGYRTAHIGKYLNSYGAEFPAEVPPGWNRWFVPTKASNAIYYGGAYNVDGRVVDPIGSWQQLDAANCKIALPSAGSCRHSTDLYRAYAIDEIGRATRSGRPFYLQVDFNAPHDDGRRDPGPTPPTRLAGLDPEPITDLDEAEAVPSAPTFIRGLQPLPDALREEIREEWKNEVRSMRGVDQAFGDMVSKIRAAGQLGNTFFLFTSDNGFFHGENRISYGKYLPHEPSTRLPLLIRGPGIPAGTSSGALASNLDLAPTILEMAGASSGRSMDGSSLLALARQPGRISRRAVLLEGFNGRGDDNTEVISNAGKSGRANSAPVLNYWGFVAGRWKYVRYAYGGEELYDVVNDPGETSNLADWEGLRVLDWARELAEGMRYCQGAACRPDASFDLEGV